jgi:hypothetical protein
VGFQSQVPSTSSAVEGQPLLNGGLAAGLAGENFLSVARNGYAGYADRSISELLGLVLLMVDGSYGEYVIWL